MIPSRARSSWTWAPTRIARGGGRDADGSGRCGLESGQQLSRGLAAAVAVAAAEACHARLAEPVSGLRGRIVGQEGERDRRRQPEEHRFGARPMRLQQGAELVACRGPGTHVVLTQPHQSLQLLEACVGWVQPAQPVPVGAQVVSQLVAVTRIGLGTGSAPAGPGGMKGGGMHRDDGTAGGQESVHHQPGRPFNDHRHLGRLAMAGKSRQRLGKRLLGMPQRPALHHPALVIQHRHVVAGAGPIPPDELHAGLLREPVVDSTGVEARCRCLIVRPSVGHVPNAGHRASARQGRQN
jgi:hypothetical protein